MKPNQFLILILLIFSCTKKQEKATIVGDWEFDKSINLNKINKDKTPPSLFNNFHEEFEFLENNECLYKNGFFDIVENKNKQERYVVFKGHKLNYNYNSPTLTLKYLNDSIFSIYKIKKITNDSLIFIDEKYKYLSFYRRIKDNTNKIEFDKIIVTSSGCFGPCRISSTTVDKSGNVNLNNYMYTEKNGSYISKITKNHFLDIQKQFNKVNIDLLNNDYALNATDGNSISVTFIKNNKIYKTITDYMGQSPTGFRQAYTDLVYLSQSLQLSRKKYKPQFDFFTIISIGNKRGRMRLSDSEGVYLQSELENSVITTANFKPNFELTFLDFKQNDEKINYIYTDGRYFKFIFLNKKEITYDLGYNFIEKNELKFELNK